jgi:hypothetical protein
MNNVKPSTVSMLLPMLGLSDATADEKTAGIRTWLADNEVSPLMEYSLRRDGFAHLLDDCSP